MRKKQKMMEVDLSIFSFCIFIKGELSICSLLQKSDSRWGRMKKTEKRKKIFKKNDAAPLGDYQYLSGRVTKVVYKRKMLKRRPFFHHRP